MRRNTAWLVAVLLVVAPFVRGHEEEGPGKGIRESAPPGIAGPGPFPSQNVQLLAHMPLSTIGGGSQSVLGSDIWGWTDTLTRRNYAIFGLTHGTSFIDITKPRQPVFVGFLPSHTGNSAWRELKVYNNYAFIVSDNNGSHGMQIFDLKQLRNLSPPFPKTFSETAHYSGVSYTHNITINTDTGFAYLVGSSKASGGLHVVNVQNPLAPVFAGNFSDDGYTHDVQVVIYHGPDSTYVGHEVAFASNEDTLTIVDVTNKSNMFQVARKSYPDRGYSHQGWLTEDHKFFFMNDELDELNYQHVNKTRTHIWDVQNLDNPIYIGFYEGVPSTIDHNCFVRGNLIFESNYTSGLRVIQIDNPALGQLHEVGYIDTYPTDDSVTFNGTWGNYPFYPNGLIAVADRQNGLFIVRYKTSFWNRLTTPERRGLAGDATLLGLSVAGIPTIVGQPVAERFVPMALSAWEMLQ